MKKLYEASSALEAHMFLDVLRQQGIIGAMEGQYLPGAIGELPANGLVRVMVDEQDWPQAQQILQAWEQSQPALEAAAPSKPPPPSKNFALRGFALGFLLALGLAYFYYRAPVNGQEWDRNHDGNIDESTTFSARGLALRTELDRNFDGKIDQITYFAANGNVENLSADDNFDGVFESRAFYEQGNIVRSEVDTDGDGYYDLKTYFKHSVAVSSEFLDRNTGFPFRLEYYKMGKLEHAEIDSDNDGKLDTRVNYDARLEISSRLAM